MNIWNKVFLALIFILSIVVVFFTSQEMKIRQQWNEGLQSLEKAIERERGESKKILEGPVPEKPVKERSLDELSLDQLKVRLHELVFERNKAWFGCIPGTLSDEGKTITPQQLGDNKPATPSDRLRPIRLVEVKLTVTGPIVEREGNEEVLRPDDMRGLVYLFDDDPEGRAGAFLGRFLVVPPAPQKNQKGYQVTLQAANDLNDAEVDLIRKSLRSTWSVYATMPKDRNQGLFDNLNPGEIEAMVSEAALAKLIDPERPLRDFDELLANLYQWRVVLQQEIDRSKRDIASLDASFAAAKQEEKNLQADIDFERKRNEAMKVQLKAVQAKVDEYDAMIKKLFEDIEATQKQNEWYVARIAEYQLRVAELIERKAERAATE